MTLYLREVPVVKVPRVLEVDVLEDDHSAAMVTYSQVVSSLVERDGGKDVGLADVRLVPLTQTVDVDPVQTIGDALRVHWSFA